MKSLAKVVAIFVGGSGLAWACAQVPMPPLKVGVGLLDIAGAWADGYKYPSNGAFRENLDEIGRSMYGSNWKNNSFKGYVISQVSVLGSSGENIVYVEKPCNEDAADGADRTSSSGGGDGVRIDTGGGGYWDYVNSWFMSQPIYTDRYGEIGEIHPV